MDNLSKRQVAEYDTPVHFYLLVLRGSVRWHSGFIDNRSDAFVIYLEGWDDIKTKAGS